MPFSPSTNNRPGARESRGIVPVSEIPREARNDGQERMRPTTTQVVVVREKVRFIAPPPGNGTAAAGKSAKKATSNFELQTSKQNYRNL